MFPSAAAKSPTLFKLNSHGQSKLPCAAMNDIENGNKYPSSTSRHHNYISCGWNFFKIPTILVLEITNNCANFYQHGM